MNEILNNTSVMEYYLTITRILYFLDTLKSDHKNNTSFERLALYDFYLKYPELLDEVESEMNFDAKYSYFHWLPNYGLYKALLSVMLSKGLVTVSDNQFYITNIGTELVSNLESNYASQVRKTAKNIESKICKKSEKYIKENIAEILNRKENMK